ncbi:flagellum-associated coiled-coil domain-containing protein 1 [Ctenodactylus gundi]
MYPNPLVYCTCWDPWGLGPRKLIKTPRPPKKASLGRPKEQVPVGGHQESSEQPEVIQVSPGYQLIRSQEQTSVTLADEMFSRKKELDSEIADKVNISRTSVICDLKEQISELMTIIEQMSRDHHAAQKLLSEEMELRCAEMKQNFESRNRALRTAHQVALQEVENKYQEILKAERSAAQGRREEMEKEYEYLRSMFRVYQDSIRDELEDKWSRQRAERESGEKTEWKKSLLQQSEFRRHLGFLVARQLLTCFSLTSTEHKMTKKFDLKSDKEKRKTNEYSRTTFENVIQEKEELLKQREKDTLQLQELRKSKEIVEEKLRAQALILESLNASLYQSQLELQKEKAAVRNLELAFQNKLAKAEERYKHAIETLAEENLQLRQRILAKTEEENDTGLERSTCADSCKCDLEILEDGTAKDKIQQQTLIPLTEERVSPRQA